MQTLRHPSLLMIARGLLAALAALLAPAAAQAAHAYAQFGDIKYPAGFQHFDWVNPAAPKGGELRLTNDSPDSNFDKYNPFTLKGSAAPGLISSDPSGYGVILFESLMVPSMDEPTTVYCLLCDDVSVPADLRSVTFRLHPKARFHDGSPVLAKDVKWSFDRQTSPEAWPIIRNQYVDIIKATVVDARTIRFDFRHASAELPIVIGMLQVFSHKWGAGKAFDKVITDIPLASGPYKIGRVDFGRDITYERNPDYWASDLNVRRGLYNFDKITYKIYKDQLATTEAFFAGEYDVIEVFRARDWARRFAGPKFRSGELIKRVLPQKNAANFQGFMINTRRDKFSDPRVREALSLAMDYEWMNRRFFYNSYDRLTSYFHGSDFAASGLPQGDELARLEPLRKQLKPEIFTQPVPTPPRTNPPDSLRSNLRRARDLLAAAGWTLRDGALRNAQGEALTIEVLDDQPTFARVVAPMAQALAKLGIEMKMRVADAAMVKKRRDAYDFDITTFAIANNAVPGKELTDRLGSAAAKKDGSYNYSGVRDPAIDALIAQVSAARTRTELVSSARALDRVVRWGHYYIPNWTSPGARTAWVAHRFAQPATAPGYFQAPSWALSTWWSVKGEKK